MRTLLFTLLVTCVCTPVIHAFIGQTPDQTLLWNDFSSATTVDSFVVLTNSHGLVSTRWDDQSETYEPQIYLTVPLDIVNRELFEKTLVLESRNNLLYFIDLTNLPDMSLLGITDIDIEIFDFEFRNNDLFIAAGFNGIQHYSLDENYNPTFVDSSLVPVNAVSLHIDNDILFVVDNYNGILSYNISNDMLGKPVDQILIDIPARRIHSNNNNLVITTDTPNLLIGTINDGQIIITDTIASGVSVDRLFIADSLAISIYDNGTWWDVINLNSGMKDRYWLSTPIASPYLGDLVSIDNHKRLLLPDREGGLRILRLDRIPLQTFAYPAWSRTGPVSTLFFHHNHLYTGGIRNPLEAWLIDAELNMSHDFILFSELNNVRATATFGDTLAILYPQIEKLMTLQLKADAPPILDTLIDSDSTLTWDVSFAANSVGGFNTMFGHGQSHLDLYIFNDTLPFTKLGILSLFGSIMDIEIIDSILVISTNKNTLWTYRIYDDFYIEFRATISSGGKMHELVALPADPVNNLPSRLIGLSSSVITLYDLSDLSNPTIAENRLLSLPVSNAVYDNNLLYTAGSQGITVFDCSSLLPEEIDYGGLPGNKIAIDNGLAAVTNGSAVHLFDLSYLYSEPTVANQTFESTLFELGNYPNPFNPITNISYTLSTTTNVRLDVFNLLGKKVITLVDSEQNAGRHSVVWDGLNERNETIASGIYLYRISADGMSEARTMLFLK